LVKPGGLTFIATINRNWLAWFIAVFGAEHVLGWLPKGTHHYAMLRKPREIKRCLDAGNFTLQASAGVAVNPFTRRMSITNSTMVNYMLCAKKASDAPEGQVEVFAGQNRSTKQPEI